MQSHSVHGLDKQAIGTALLSKRKMVVGVCMGKVPFTREPSQTSGSCQRPPQWMRFINASPLVGSSYSTIWCQMI